MNTEEVVPVNIDLTTEFTITEKLVPDFMMATKISEWLHNNISNLTDDKDKKIFNKVSYGFDSEKLKTFGKKPTADIYIDHVEYNRDFDYMRPVSVHTIVVFYMKGANDVAYRKTAELHDYLMQEFISNDDWRLLDGIVRDTMISNSQLMSQPASKRWGVMGVFELTHHLY